MTLNGGQRTALTAKDGSFVFRDVDPGVYLLEVLSTTFHYSTMKIKLDEKTGIIAIEYKVQCRCLGGTVFSPASWLLAGFRDNHSLQLRESDVFQSIR